MKLLILVLCTFSYVLAHVKREVCTANDDCSRTACNDGNSVICQHPAGAQVETDGGLCTCADTGSGGSGSDGCVVASECYDDQANLPCANPLRHCLDSTCICDALGCVHAYECYGDLANLPCTDALRHCRDSTCICNPIIISREFKYTKDCN